MRAFLLSLLLLPALASAQTLEVHEVRVHEVDRSSWPSVEADPVERAVVRDTFAPGDDWRTVQADSSGWIRDEALTRGYAYADLDVGDDGVFILEAMGYRGVEIDGEPRVGNVYGGKDRWESWEPHFDYSLLPVRLHRGENALLFFGNRFGVLRARLWPAKAPLSFNARDITLPDLVAGEPAHTWGAIVVMNATADFVADAKLEIALEGMPPQMVDVPVLPPLGVRKVGFSIQAPAFGAPGPVSVRLALTQDGRSLDETTLSLAVKNEQENRRVTFVSHVDGSVQYYGILPARDGPGNKALVLSLHGAGVEAINQSGSYEPLSWAEILAPTNRRPFGFNWEGWGRLDALEVLDLGLRSLPVDADRVYLTGHSMGGHGSWHLATLCPDRFAAVGPSAGWISLWSYRLEAPLHPADAVTQMVERPMLPSRTLEMAPNLADLGVYVLHGGADDNVPVEQAHLIVDRLREFHHDFVFHEQPGVGHWWDLSDEPGTDCVTWAPMFDFFARHRRPGVDEVREIRFQTPSPGVSAWDRWVCIAAQAQAFVMSSVDVRLDPLSRRVSGRTDNVFELGLDLAATGLDSVWIELDGDRVVAAAPPDGKLWLSHDDAWHPTQPDARRKGPHRTGPFRQAWLHHAQLVVGTQGTAEETARALAKARYDAEYLWYQGNASVDVILDTMFDAGADPDRNVILYGNADTNARWAELWSGDVEVARGRLRVGERSLAGDGLGVLALQPRPGSTRALVGIVGATGVEGMRLLDRRPYLVPEVSYPDLTVFEDLGDGTVVRAAGFFGNDWSLADGEIVWAN